MKRSSVTATYRVHQGNWGRIDVIADANFNCKVHRCQAAADGEAQASQRSAVVKQEE